MSRIEDERRSTRLTNDEIDDLFRDDVAKILAAGSQVTTAIIARRLQYSGTHSRSVLKRIGMCKAGWGPSTHWVYP